MRLIELQLRNIFSYGNNITKIPLDGIKPTLIIGENHDAMINGEYDANGTGKSAILNALLYVFFGRTGDNKHKVDALINNINKKDLYVSVVFEASSGVYYKIERWRKNKKMGGVSNNGVKITMGDSVDTIDPKNPITPAIRSIDTHIAEHILGMEFDIFARIATIIGSYDPFLDLPATSTNRTSQTSILEELFGQKILTEKSVILKKRIKDTEADIKSLTELNERIIKESARYEEQLNLAKNSIDDWDKASLENIRLIKEDIKRLETIDFDAELKLIETFDKVTSRLNSVTVDHDAIGVKLKTHESNKVAFDDWNVATERKLNSTKKLLTPYNGVDFDEEYNKLQSIIDMRRVCDACSVEQATLKSNISDIIQSITKLDSEIAVLEESKCPYCKQEFHDNKLKISDKKSDLSKLGDEYKVLHATLDDSVNKYSDARDSMGLIDCLYADIRGYDASKATYDGLIKTHTDMENETNPYITLMLDDSVVMDLKTEARKFKSEITKLGNKLDKTDSSSYTLDVLYAEQANLKQFNISLVEKINETNPHEDTVTRLTKVFDGIDELQVDEVDALRVKLKHQDFLLKLLTKKDSFIRQALLDVNLPLLNTRLRYYLDAIGLFHNVTFTKGMTVSITQFDNSIDFSNLSTGQKARINLAIAFAFRDIVQERHQKINFCILDECLDHGLSNLGVKLAAKMIKQVATDNGLSMYVITHRDEIKSSFDKTLKTILKGGLTTVKFS